MSSRDFSRVRRLFEAAMNLPISQQEAFVQRFCVDDPILRDEVLGLLASDREMDSARRLLDDGGLRRATVGEVPERIGSYRAVSVIASGGMGVVYEGIQESPRRRVAIKTLLIGPRDERALARFQAEIDVLARLEHPFIARIYSAGTYQQEEGSDERGLPFYVMEYIEGARSLTEYVKQKQFTIRQRLQLFCEVCEAVEFAHGQGVIHRDLKPGNILVNSDGRPKIIDFGTARLMEEDGAEGGGMTRPGEIIGTLNYMSPEQISPTDVPPDARSDVYSLGCVLYELLVGKSAHSAKGQTFAEMAASVIFGKVEPPSHWDGDLSRVLDLVCSKAMMKRREERYDSAADLADDIQRFLDARQVQVVAPSLQMMTRLFVQRRPVVAAVAIMFFLTSGVGLHFMRKARGKQADLVHVAEQAWAKTREGGLRGQSIRAGLSLALEGLSDGSFKRRDGGAVLLEEVAAIDGVEGMNELVLAANRSEIAAVLAHNLRFPKLAQDLYAEAHEAWVDARGEEDESTLRLRLAQLTLEHEEGAREDFEERLEVLREDLSGGAGGLTEYRLGVIHLQVCLLFDEGDAQGAEAGAWELLREQTRVLGANHPYTLDTSWLLGRILMWHGRGPAALQHLESAHIGFLCDLGKLHPKTLECQVDYALSLESTRCPHAGRVLSEAYENLQSVLGSDHPSTLHARIHGLRLRAENGVTGEVETELERALIVCRSSLGIDHSLTKLCVGLEQQLAGPRDEPSSVGEPPLKALVNRR